MNSTEINKIIVDYLKNYNPKLIGIFGSYAREEQNKESDIDILVSFKKTLTLIDLVRIKNKLSQLLNINVDLITDKSIHPKIRPYIEKDLKIIFQ